MTTQFDIFANLHMRSQGAARNLDALGGSLQRIGQTIRGTQSLLGGLTRNVLAIGAAYVGVNALAQGFRSVIGGSILFNAELEKTRIGLAAVLSSSSGQSFASGMRQSQVVFAQLTEDALRSTATTQELFQIYQGILGPLRAAGASMDVVREVTNNTVAAASALNVDFAQAQRDIMAMATGVAGVDVKLFRMLRSTGAIAEDAQAFNQLTAPERVDRIRRALGRFEAAADAYGQSWAGLTSTLKDILQQFMAAGMGPVFERIKGFLRRTNDTLLANKDTILGTLRATGERVAQVLGRVLDRASRGLEYVLEHWDEIGDRIGRIVVQVKDMAPRLLAAAKAFAAFEVGRQVVGTGASVAGGAASGLGALMETLAPLFEALSVAAVPIVAILSVLAGWAIIIYERWQDFVDLFAFMEPVLAGLWEDFQDLGTALWDVLRPILKLLGALWLPMLIGGFFALVIGLRVVVGILKIVVEALATVTKAFEEYIVDPLIDFIMYLAKYAGFLIGESEHLGEAERRRDPLSSDSGAGDPLRALERAIGSGEVDWNERYLGITPDAPAARARVVNDLRGSRITVHQEFRQADPDRVAIQMIEDIARNAEAQVQSGFVPALTR